MVLENFFKLDGTPAKYEGDAFKMALRETESSKYTLRDTPIFTCIQMPVENILRQLF